MAGNQPTITLFEITDKDLIKRLEKEEDAVDLAYLREKIYPSLRDNPITLPEFLRGIALGAPLAYATTTFFMKTIDTINQSQQELTDLLGPVGYWSTQISVPVAIFTSGIYFSLLGASLGMISKRVLNILQQRYLEK